MDEVVEGVASNIALKVHLQPRVVSQLAALHDVQLGQFRDPLRICGAGHGQDALGGKRAQVLLDRGLLLSIAFVLRPVGERRRAVLEANDELLALLTICLSDEVVT